MGLRGGANEKSVNLEVGKSSEGLVQIFWDVELDSNVEICELWLVHTTYGII